MSLPVIDSRPSGRTSAAFYLYYVSLYAPVAITISFFPLWIRAQGLSEQQTGLVLALGAGLAVLVNPMIGAMADQARSRKTILLAMVAASAMSAAMLTIANGFVGVLLVFLATRACSASLLPLSESIAIAGVARHGLDFGRLRSAGSMAVVAMSIVLGWLVDRAGTDIIAIVFLVAYIAQGIVGLALPGDAVRVGQRVQGPIMQVLRRPGFLLFLCSAAVSQACHGFFYSYGVLFWKREGFSGATIGYLWALGVMAEIVVFTVGARIVSRASAPRLIALACAASALRWTLIGMAPRMDVAIFAQLLQGATLGFTQLGAAEYMRTRMPANVLSSSTGVYAAFTGLLTAVCVYAGSFLFANVGGRAFLLPATLCLLGVGSALMLARSRAERHASLAEAGTT